MNLTGTTGPDCQIITVNEDRIDAVVALQFKEQMRRVVDNTPKLVLLDLTQVQFVDSSGLGAIVAAMKALGPDRKMALAGMTPTVEKVFRLTRMDTVFDIYKAPDDVMAAR